MIERAARALDSATALIVAAGAGMGVDSGLPDFRGDEGFWKAYPPYGKLGLSFIELAKPTWFERDPTLAWGFYGHRTNLYRSTVPHAGFDILRRWMDRARDGGFVFTSNVDHQFQRAGFDGMRILECHGTLEWMQCVRRCSPAFPAATVEVEVDLETFRAKEPLPKCPACGAMARPNVLMFDDFGWDAARAEDQDVRMNEWLAWLPPDARIVVVECGAGTAVPTVREFSEHVVATRKATLVRINVREPEVPPGQIGISMGAKAALEAIDRARVGV